VTVPPSDPRVGGDLALAVHEVVVNAHEHGRSPVETRVEVVDGEVEVLVRDQGSGPASLAPPTGPPGPDAERGRGRWLAHQLAVVEERRTADGFEVRLRQRATGRPTPRG
jgi:anti-sigma regulatory factor (Ser/Thr protein kinase)